MLDQPDAACRTGFENDDALFGERLEMLFGGVVRGKAEGAGDFGTRRRRAEDLQRVANEIEDFLLSRGEFDHDHGLLFRYCDFIQQKTKDKKKKSLISRRFNKFDAIRIFCGNFEQFLLYFEP